MKKELNFEVIKNYKDFYNELSKQLLLPPYFGNNLDALNDVLHEMKDTLNLVFYNMNLNQLEQFEDLLEMLENIENSKTDFSFTYRLKIDHE